MKTTDLIRRFPLAEVSTGGSDTSYDLVFTSGGEMFVEIRKGYDQAFKKDDAPRRIAQEVFGKYTVSGRNLCDLVTERLDQILEKKPFSWPDVPVTVGESPA